ncbi:hypothetical protein OG741_08920 [Streptomyces sp. NBC_01410]|uniref:hypothetical protein n=1 Tax=Streptomyces sp. NBC_01410 TaxID=2903856 RepID=UPI0032538053
MQFARWDYQRRARLANLSNPSERQWLTLARHLPHRGPRRSQGPGVPTASTSRSRP